MKKIPLNRIGGNTLMLWLGQFMLKMVTPLLNKANQIIEDNKTKIVTNPSAEFYSPFIMIINFTVDVSSKYHIVLQGDYKDKYKETGDKSVNLSEDELYIMINQNKANWYKKF